MGNNLLKSLTELGGDIASTQVADILDMVVNNNLVTENVIDKQTFTNDEQKNSGYYYKIDGEYLGKDEIGTNVFIADGKIIKKVKDENDNTKQKSITEFINPQSLNLTNYELLYCSGIIANEGFSLEELLFIAHTSYNESRYSKKTVQKLLSTSYSTVPQKKKNEVQKIALSKDEEDFKKINKNAIAAIIDIYNGGADPTNGSQRWDGEDFLAWGLSHCPTKFSADHKHAKFRQFGTIKISKELFDEFSNNIGSTVSYKKSGYINPKKDPNAEDVNIFDVPEDVFLDSKNWLGDTFVYNTNVNKLTLEATYVRNKTIYWKILQ